MRTAPVSDPEDPRLVELTGLTDAQARARTEAEHGCFVVEGLLALEAAVASAHPIRAVLVADTKLERVRRLVHDVDTDVYVGTRDLLRAVTGFDVHRGVLASAGRLPLPDPATLLGGARRVLAVEGVNDHENLGALFRNAAAFGVDAVLLDPTCADPLYRRAVRVSVGHVLRVPWTRIPAAPEGIEVVRRAGLATLALTPAGDITVREAAECWADRPVAWLVGAEGSGLGAEALGRADELVRIPVETEVDSLNVATAAAVAMAFSWSPAP